MSMKITSASLAQQHTLPKDDHSFRNGTGLDDVRTPLLDLYAVAGVWLAP